MLDKRLFNAGTELTEYIARVWRAVESQEAAATLNIVDTMEEQSLLETLLDEVKPKYRKGTEGMHYLLKTAFRYPPLQYGSRFGTRTMPSFFYASEEPETALIETAYYRFLFLSHMATPYQNVIDSEHSVFSVQVKSNTSLDLCSPKFKPIRAQLANPSDYSVCQALGNWAVNHRSTDVIRFESARRRNHNNLAIAEPKAIRSKKPLSQETWLCRTALETISFSSRSAKQPLTVPIELFLVDGVFPSVN